MQTLSSFKSIQTHKKISNILKSLETQDLSSTEFDNKFLRVACQLYRENNDNIRTLQTYIDFDAVFNNKTKNTALFDEMWCGYYDEDINLKQDYTCTILHKYMSENKIIFCWTDFCDYAMDTTDGINNIVTHSSLTILKPDGDKYFAYQFNPHGRCQIDYEGYTKYITRKRSQYYECGEPLDVYVIKCFLKAMEEQILIYNQKKVIIQYDNTSKHNYFGTNLQSGDNYGCCSIFPFIIFYHVCVDMYKTNILCNDTINKCYRFPSIANLIKNNMFTQMIDVIMSLYFKEFKYEVIHYYKCNQKNEYTEESFHDCCEDILEKRGTLYIKYITGSVLDFMTQEYFD